MRAAWRLQPGVARQESLICWTLPRLRAPRILDLLDRWLLLLIPQSVELSGLCVLQQKVNRGNETRRQFDDAVSEFLRNRIVGRRELTVSIMCVKALLFPDIESCQVTFRANP